MRIRDVDHVEHRLADENRGEIPHDSHVVSDIREREIADCRGSTGNKDIDHAQAAEVRIAIPVGHVGIIARDSNVQGFVRRVVASKERGNGGVRDIDHLEPGIPIRYKSVFSRHIDADGIIGRVV